MTQSYETGRQAMTDIGAKQPHELLLMLGGVLAVLLTVAVHGIQWATSGIRQSDYATVATTMIINIVLGASLWASSGFSAQSSRRPNHTSPGPGASSASRPNPVAYLFDLRPAEPLPHFGRLSFDVTQNGGARGSCPVPFKERLPVEFDALDLVIR